MTKTKSPIPIIINFQFDETEPITNTATTPMANMPNTLLVKPFNDIFKLMYILYNNHNFL